MLISTNALQRWEAIFAPFTSMTISVFGIAIRSHMWATSAVIKELLDVGFKGCFMLESYSLPFPRHFGGRQVFVKDGITYDKVIPLPLSLKIRSERLMLDITPGFPSTHNEITL